MISQWKRQYEEAHKALRFSRMMDAKERAFWQKQKRAAGSKLENAGIILTNLENTF